MSVRSGPPSSVLSPVVFDPIFKPKIWGGRRLEAVLGKSLPAGELIGESWELADLPEGQSVVREGPCKGRTLHELVCEWGGDLLGRTATWDGRFPLLIKFLDACQDLSVQVHPPQHVVDVEPGAVLKNEAWYCLAAEPGGMIYHGLAPGATRESFLDATRSGDIAPLLRRVDVRMGECYYLPSGTVHALGAGVLVAEVQTPSDTTYRLFDWNRIDESTGKPRALHIEQAMRCIDFDAPAPDIRQARSHTANLAATVSRLASCEHFAIDRVWMAQGSKRPIPYGGLAVWILLDGEFRINYGKGGSLVVRKGDVVLLPAALQDGRLDVLRDAAWLEVTIP